MKASEATVMKMIGDSAQRLKPVYDLLQKKIAGDPNITTHLDETGFRTEEKLHWVHTTSSKTMSHFRVGNSRGDILLDLAGNVIHDCYAPYWKILGVKHGTCNFHITRELKALCNCSPPIQAPKTPQQFQSQLLCQDASFTFGYDDLRRQILILSLRL